MFYLILPMLASAFIYIMALETGVLLGLSDLFVRGRFRFCHAEQGRFHWHSLFFSAIFPCCETAWNGSAGSFGFLLRLAVFNAAVLTFFWVSVYVLGMKELLESLGDYGKYGGWIRC